MGTASELLALMQSKGDGQSIAFPDVCKVPAPPAPFTPTPYPNTQLEENLKSANKADAAAKIGNRKAKELQQKAIDNLFSQTGIKARSATQAVLIGKSVNGKYVAGTAQAPLSTRLSSFNR